MTLASGTKLGPYEILAPLGAGGMGEVYKARDTRLERSVAVKVLPRGMSASPEVRQRFEREAKTISQLSHAHICALYDVGREADTEYLVMELLDGETLAERLARGPLSLEQTLRYGQEIAGALDKAHRQGIVHRDLKPGNVMLTNSGVKLLDFGLAKVFEPAAAKESLTSIPTKAALTQEGTILGTFQYMAPEQLEGRDADARTDIFALGCVLYEMATGRKAFSGASQASLISAIMQTDPPAISAVQAMAPPALDRVVRTCLAKDPEDRWQSAGDVAKELKWVAEGSAAGVAAPTALAARRRGRERLLWIAALLVTAVAGALGAHRLWPDRSLAAPPVRFEIRLPATDPDDLPVLSQDGSAIAYAAPDAAGARRLWIRQLGSADPSPLETIGVVRNANSIAWSPDGRSLAFALDRKITRVSVSGGAIQPLCDTQSTFGISWGARGDIVFVPRYGGGISRVSAAGGSPAPVTALDRAAGEVAHLWPKFLSDGRRFLYMARVRAGREGEQGWITAAALGEKGVRRIRSADALVGVGEGRLLYATAGTLYAQPFDERTLSLRGEPSAIPGRFLVHGSVASVLVSVSGANLAFRSDPPRLRRLLILDRSGRKLSEVGGAEAYIDDLAISPDGRRALVSRKNAKGQSEVWIADLERGTSARTGSGVEEEVCPHWSPDGERFTLSWDRDGPYDLVIRRADGGSPGEVALRSEYDKISEGWTPDGKRLLFLDSDPKHPGLGIVEVGSAAAPTYVPGTESGNTFRLSPNGRWLLSCSAETGRPEIYVQRFPEGTARQQVSVDGGGNARWNPDGREIFFVSPAARLMAVAFDPATDSAPRLSIPAPLFAVSRVQLEQLYMGTWASNWAMFPDGKRFLMVQPVSDTDPSSIMVVLNWPGQLTK